MCCAEHWGSRASPVQSYESNRDYVKAALGELQDYLLSPTLFWTLPGRPAPAGSPLLQLTLGNLLLALDSLAAASEQAGGAQRAEVQRLQSEWDVARTRWAAHVERKVRHELASRQRQWLKYVEDVIEAQSAEDYADNLRPRLLAERLLEVLPDRREAARIRDELARLDDRIAPFLQAGPFLLDPALQARYPERALPFLYRRTRSPS